MPLGFVAIRQTPNEAKAAYSIKLKLKINQKCKVETDEPDK
jgi:hypothetical protein